MTNTIEYGLRELKIDGIRAVELDGVADLDVAKTFDCGQCFRFEPVENSRVLGAIAFQHQIEQRAFCAGGSDYNVPIQTVGDFLEGIGDMSLPNDIRKYLGSPCSIEGLVHNDLLWNLTVPFSGK